jgi:hypothetical protein
MDIDLGDEVKVKVKWKGRDYELREPTVAEVEKIGEGAAQMSVIDFLTKLGLPGDVAGAMGVSKARALIDGITDLVTKKK